MEDESVRTIAKENQVKSVMICMNGGLPRTDQKSVV
jgi:hypothetical protein